MPGATCFVVDQEIARAVRVVALLQTHTLSFLNNLVHLMGPTGNRCIAHGGDLDQDDSAWRCDECARSGINRCACGSYARLFVVPLMVGVACESCTASVLTVGAGKNIRTLWNNGLRGR